MITNLVPKTDSEIIELLLQHAGLEYIYRVQPIPEQDLPHLQLVKTGWDVYRKDSGRIVGSIILMVDGTTYAGNGQDVDTYPTLTQAIVSAVWSW